MIVETYRNTLYEGHTCHRYWIPGGFFLMVGGSLLSAEDFGHLQKEFGITDVINAETEHDDTGKVPSENLCQVQVPDNGDPFPAEAVLKACLFVSSKVMNAEATVSPKFYVHCQMGGSRSPAFAYAMLRACFGLSKEESLGAIRAARKDDWGEHYYHKSYVASIESALAGVLGGG